MCSAAFQPGSSANDFSITSCNCRRSAALTGLKWNCLGAAIAGNFVPAKSQTKLTYLVFFMVKCSAQTTGAPWTHRQILRQNYIA
ncbi:MAG: hypothetical protein DMF19_04355 [Verrucomicrobia bacterium]|nr:MAG: hypothetical protein DMF19_04355 [Verrucomicrobiota bacterium]